MIRTPPDAAPGTWRDFKFPWKQGDWSMRETLSGPGHVELLPSIKQHIVRPSLRPVPRSRFEVLFDLAGDALVWLMVVVIVLGLVEHLLR